MSAETNKPAVPEAPPRFLQFSLGTMFVVTTAVAIVCSLLFSMPTVAGFPLLLVFSVALPAALTTVIIYGRGYQRTFCIGALFPAGMFLVMFPFIEPNVFRFPEFFRMNEADWLVFRVVVVGFWVSSILVGSICVGVRRLVERRAASP